MCDITVTENNNLISVNSPYNPEFISAAKQISGRWNPDSKTWDFKDDYREKVHEILADVYGWRAETTGEVVDVRVTLTGLNADKRTVYFAGRQIAWRPGRDMRARVADNVIIENGTFPSSGGSVRYPTVIDSPDREVTLKIKAVPMDSLDAAGMEYEIIEDSGDIDREALEAEKERLTARLEEIEKLLASAERA